MDDDKKRPKGRAGGPGRPRQGAAAGSKRFGKPASGGGRDGAAKRPSRADGPPRDRPAGEQRAAERGGEAKPFRRQDGAKRAYAGRDGEAPRKPRPGKWERREEKEASGEGRGPRKPFSGRDDGRKPFAARGDRPRPPERDGEAKPFRRQDGAKRAFAGRDGAASGKPRPGKREREAATAGEGGAERIARRLARVGIASRRDAEEMVAAGRVSVNGKVLDSPAFNVAPSDRIEVDGKEIPAAERTRLFLFHKPAGVVTTSRDPEGRRTVFDVLPAGLPRLMTVGRLDINTEGLLLLTNDGGLSRVLELPSTGWLRRYRVRVHGKVEPEALTALKDGIAVDGVFYGAVEAALDREQGSNAWLTVGIREGKNREVKNVLGAIGLDVTRLIRVSYGPFQLGDLAEGEVREIRGRMLRDQLGERLIAESGANFEAPILNEFSSKAAGSPPLKAKDAGPRPNRKHEREQKREDALGRLQTTKPARGRPDDKRKPSGKPAGKFDTKGGAGKPARPARGDDRPAERSRTSNVWMAPGAKPMGEKKAAAVAERSEGRRYAGKPRPAGGKGGQGKSGPGKGRPGGKPGGPRKPRGEG